MHEYVYADRILQSVLQEADGALPAPLVVNVEVGEMLGLSTASLRSAYEVLSKGTKASGTKLRVKFTKGEVRCGRCGFEGRIPVARHEHRIDPAFSCPECGSSLRVISGLEVKLIGIEPPKAR